jgi:4'-phosphopantetheinyl transferase
MGSDDCLELGQADIHLWLVFPEEHSAAQVSRCRDFLTHDEVAKQQRFHFEKDRVRELVTRALVRTVLSRYVPLAPCEWRFSTGRYGRPYVTNPEAAPANIVFNISHTEGLVVLATARSRALGVDVENWASRPGLTHLAQRFFAPSEAAALNAIPPNQQQERFFEYWTFKESYIKAREMGLSIPLHQFSFGFPTEHSVVFSAGEQASDKHRWKFWQFRPSPRHVLALCADRAGDAPIRLQVLTTVPGECERPLPMVCTRVSDRSS